MEADCRPILGKSGLVAPKSAEPARRPFSPISLEELPFIIPGGGEPVRLSLNENSLIISTHPSPTSHHNQLKIERKTQIRTGNMQKG
jgi:hypothetical protein